jgi:F0F1-type ATP synthase epsilon subunit
MCSICNIFSWLLYPGIKDYGLPIASILTTYFLIQKQLDLASTQTQISQAQTEISSKNLDLVNAQTDISSRMLALEESELYVYIKKV